MTKKAKIPREGEKRFSNKKLMVILFVVASIIVSGSVLSFWLLQTPKVPEVNFSLKAAIIDQLGKEFPNSQFVRNVTDVLESRGFNVTYYNQTIDVNFYKGLVKGNYGIIILRAHSALREDNSTVDIFTSEEFSDNKYLPELENGFLTKGEFLYSPGKFYFAITSRFIDSLEGRFPKSIVIAMGCWSLKPRGPSGPGGEQMAQAFIGKGAKAYVGWTDLVLPQDTDNETLKLLRLLLTEDKPIGDAVSQTQSYSYKEYGGYRYITTNLSSYPPEASNLRISNLITEAKASLTLQGTSSMLRRVQHCRKGSSQKPAT